MLEADSTSGIVGPLSREECCQVVWRDGWHHCNKRCIEVIRFRFLGIQDFDGIGSTRDSEDRTADKIF